MKTRRPWGLRRRMLLALLAITGVAVLIGAALVFLEAQSPEETLEASTFAHQAEILAAGLRFDGEGRVDVRLDRTWARIYDDPDLAYYTVFDARGRAVARSANLAAPLPRLAPGAAGQASRLQVVYPGPRLALAISAPQAHVLVVGRGLPDADQIGHVPMDDLAERLGGLVALALAAMLIAHLVVDWSLRPLRQVAQQAADVGPGNPDARLATGGVPPEITPLVEAVNASLERMSEAYASERALTAAAAHALRTPLAVLQLRLQTAGDPDLPSMRRDVEHLTRLVTQLLSLARKEQGADTPRPAESRDLTRLARDAIVAVLPLADACGRQIQLEAYPSPVQVHAPPGDLDEAVINLLENAITHGRGTVTVRTGVKGSSSAWIEVADEGPGVADNQREAMFGRFRKADASSVGAGLGLAIVRHVARSLGGEATFVERATLRIDLPMGGT